jgi:uncharacterized membrane protein
MSAPVFFDAVIEPNPPLPPNGLFLVVFAIAAISFVAGIIFILHGAWPVTPFLGADVLLLYWAFVLVRERAKHREYIRVTPDLLTVERRRPGLPAVRHEFNPYWLRVEHHDPERMGAPIALVSHGKRLIVGSFLGADERANLADALRAALAQARATPNHSAD